MKKKILYTSLVILGAILLPFLEGCSGNEGEKAQTFKKGQVIETIVDNYQLTDILLAPKYNTSDANGNVQEKGYAVVFLQQKPTAPVSMTGTDPNRVATSRVDLYLLEGENSIHSEAVGFSTNPDQVYQGKMSVYFKLPPDKEFPQKGVLSVKENNETTTYHMDFSGIDIAGSL
jgi:hypothetical protein